MPFNRSGGVTKLPTHLKWAQSNPAKLGKAYPIVQILQNIEWRTITFITTEFRCNEKMDSEEHFCSVMADLQSEVESGKPVIALIVDKSNPDELFYGYDVEIFKASKSKGGRNVQWKQGYAYIEPPSSPS